MATTLKAVMAMPIVRQIGMLALALIIVVATYYILGFLGIIKNQFDPLNLYKCPAGTTHRCGTTVGPNSTTEWCGCYSPSNNTLVVPQFQ
ncbi:Uncharacterised protein [uncultured archaeon]|nr:Uncharacterised protein [uncultured archaeon]